MQTMTDSVKFVLRARSFKGNSLNKVGIVHGEHYVEEEDDDAAAADDDGDEYEHVILLSVLKIGAVIGEIALLSQEEKRTASVLTTQHCELYSLDEDNFNYIRNAHAEWHDILINSAEQRMVWTKQMKALVQNDDIRPEDLSAIQANNFLGKRRGTAARVVAPFHHGNQAVKRDGQTHWDYMIQRKMEPTVRVAKEIGRIGRTSSQFIEVGLERIKRTSKQAEERIRSLRRSKTRDGTASARASADPPGGEAKAGGGEPPPVVAGCRRGSTRDELITEAVRSMSVSPGGAEDGGLDDGEATAAQDHLGDAR